MVPEQYTSLEHHVVQNLQTLWSEEQARLVAVRGRVDPECLGGDNQRGNRRRPVRDAEESANVAVRVGRRPGDESQPSHRSKIRLDRCLIGGQVELGQLFKSPVDRRHQIDDQLENGHAFRN